MFNQLVTLPTHIDGGEFSDPKVSEDNILRIEHEFVEPENGKHSHFWKHFSFTGILDQAHLRQSRKAKKNAEVKTFTHYYSDHDSVTIILR